METGTFRLFDALAATGKPFVEKVDFQDEAAGKPGPCENARMVWLVNTPRNPLLRVTDIARVAEGVERGKNAAGGGQIPFCRRRCKQTAGTGADIVVHSSDQVHQWGTCDCGWRSCVAGDQELETAGLVGSQLLSVVTGQWPSIAWLTPCPLDCAP